MYYQFHQRAKIWRPGWDSNPRSFRLQRNALTLSYLAIFLVLKLGDPPRTRTKTPFERQILSLLCTTISPEGHCYCYARCLRAHFTHLILLRFISVIQSLHLFAGFFVLLLFPVL